MSYIYFIKAFQFYFEIKNKINYKEKRDNSFPYEIEFYQSLWEPFFYYVIISTYVLYYKLHYDILSNLVSGGRYNNSKRFDNQNIYIW